MLNRRARFQKLLDLREREREDRRVALLKAQAAQKETRLVMEERQRELREAALHFRGEPGTPRPAQDWQGASDWLQDRVQRLEKAIQQNNLAKERVRLCSAALMRAEQEKKKVEKLLARLVEEELRAQRLVEQKETDEFAARAMGLRERDEA